MIRPKPRSRMPFDHVAGHVEDDVEIGRITVVPVLGRHAVQRAVARDAGVVDQHVDRPEIRLDLGDTASLQASKSPTSNL